MGRTGWVEFRYSAVQLGKGSVTGNRTASTMCMPAIENYIRASLASNPEQTSLIGIVFALRTYIASFYGDKPALFNNARSALDRLTKDEAAGQRCGVSLVLSNAYLTEGTLEAADQTLIEAIAAGKKARRPHVALTAMSNLVMVLCLQRKLKRAAQVCQEGFLLVPHGSGFVHRMGGDSMRTAYAGGSGAAYPSGSGIRTGTKLYLVTGRGACESGSA